MLWPFGLKGGGAMGNYRTLLLFVVAVVYSGLAGAATVRTAGFKNNPNVFNVVANQPFTVDLDTLLAGPAEGTLTWAPAGATPVPTWLTLNSTTHTLSGTPGVANEGTVTFSISVDDSATPEQAAIGVFQFNVAAPYAPPAWLQNPIKFTADAGTLFSASIAADAKDPQALTLTFALGTGGPSWLSMDSSGNLTGTPAASNLGANNYTVTVTDSAGLSAQASLVVTVIGPPTWVVNPITFNGTANVAFTASIAADAKDPQGLALTYTLASGGPSWLSMTSAGALSGTPTSSNLGANNFTVTATNAAGLSAQASLVIRVSAPPQWTVNPITFTATAGSPFTASIAADAKDPAGLNLSFSLNSGGPAWLSMDSSGNLTGTPAVANLGANNYTVTVTNAAGLSAQASLVVTVVAPPSWLQNPIQFTADATVPFSASIAADAKDPAGLPLTFTLSGGPAWLSMDSKGDLTGTPALTDAGANTYTVTATNSDGLSANASLIVTVVIVPQTPLWLKNPILFTAVAGIPFSATIATDAKDPVGLPLSFSLSPGGPAWLSMDTLGNLSGVPTAATPGPNQYSVTVVNSAGLSASATLIITVTAPPVWLQNPISLNAYTNVAFAASIANDAKDPQGLPLTFSLASGGPAWLKMDASGNLSGTPLAANVGLNTYTVTVTDSAGLTASATLNITVYGSPIWLQNPITFTTIATLPFTASIAADAKDPQGSTLTFTLSAGPAWLSMDSLGNLKGTPAMSNLGANTYTVTVKNVAGLTATATLVVTVNASTQPPVWLKNPITFTTTAAQPFSASIGSDAKDPLGLALTFSLATGGPAWLSMDNQGNLSGTPARSNVGANNYTVTVTNAAGLSAQASLVITVIQPTNTQTVQVDSAVPGAPIELLWNVDYPQQCDEGPQNFKANVQYFFDALNTAQIHDSGVLISSDAKMFDGVPMTSPTTGMLMLWSDPNLATTFGALFDLSYSGGDCSDCDNSPIWSMQRFTDHLPTLSINQNGYNVTGVPIDSLVFTERADNYPHYTAQNATYKNYTPTDFANEFVSYFDKSQKALRINALTPQCLDCDDTKPEAKKAKSNSLVTAKDTGTEAYQALVTVTKGTYYTEACDMDWEQMFQDYAQKVITRAYIDAKRVIPLTKVPYDPTKIVVTLGTTVLTGNTGSPADLWTYDATQNAVIINWSLIDDTQIAAGTMLTITYPI